MTQKTLADIVAEHNGRVPREKGLPMEPREGPVEGGLLWVTIKRANRYGDANMRAVECAEGDTLLTRDWYARELAVAGVAELYRAPEPEPKPRPRRRRRSKSEE